jgi:hypothetical protein
MPKLGTDSGDKALVYIGYVCRPAHPARFPLFTFAGISRETHKGWASPFKWSPSDDQARHKVILLAPSSLKRKTAPKAHDWQRI